MDLGHPQTLQNTTSSRSGLLLVQLKCWKCHRTEWQEKCQQLYQMVALPENLAATSTAVIASLESCLKTRRVSVSSLDVIDQERKLTQQHANELELERCLVGFHGVLQDMMPTSPTGTSCAISPASAAVLLIPFPTLLQTALRPSEDNVNPNVKLLWPPRMVELAARCLLSIAQMTAGGMIIALALAPATTFSNDGFVSVLTSLACIVLAVDPQKKEDAAASLPCVSSSDTEALQSICLGCIASLLSCRGRGEAGNVIVAPPTTATAAAWEMAESSLVEAGNGNFIAMIIQAARTVLRTSKYGDARRAALSVFEGLQGFFMGGEGCVRRELWKRVLPGTFSCFYHVALHSTHSSEALRSLECVFVLLRHVFTPISVLTTMTGEQKQGANVLDDFASLLVLAKSTQVADDEAENFWSGVRSDIDEDVSCGDGDGLSARLDIVLPSLLYHCRRSNNPRVRASSIKGSSMLLQIKKNKGGNEDNDTLVLGPKSNSAAFETLLVMRWDCIPDVSKEAKRGLENYRLSLSQKEWQELRSLSINRILTICDTLPHMVGSVSEDRLLQQLDLLASHVELLKEDICLVFNIGSSAIFNSLGKILELDMGAYASTGQNALILENPSSPSLSHKNSQLTDECSSSSSATSIVYPTSYQRKYLLHCRESRTWATIKRTLHTIGRYVGPKLLSDALGMHLFKNNECVSIEDGHESSPGLVVSRQAHLSWVKRGQSVCLVVAEALTGTLLPSRSIPKHMLDIIVHTVLRSDAWWLPLSAHSSPFTSSLLSSTTTSLMTSDMVNANVVLVSLMLQVLGAAITAAEKEALQDCMMVLIYPLLEKATAESIQVKQAALCTLGRVASALETPDLRSLLRNHMDYIVDELVARLDEGPDGPEDEECLSTRYIQSGWLSSLSSSYMSLAGVVLALLQYSGQHTMTPLLKDLKRAVLKQVDATWWSPDAAQANVSVMQSLVESLNMEDIILASKAITPGIWKEKKMKEEGALNDKDVWFEQLVLDYGEPEGADRESLKGVFDMKGMNNPDDLGDFDLDEVLEEGHDTPREQHAKFVSSCPETILLLDILDRCSLFINMPATSLSVDVARCVGVCWSKLAELRADSVLLPSVHDLWPALMGRLSSIENLYTEGRFTGPPLLAAAAGLNRERGGETCVLLALHPLLQIVSSLSGICGDFLGLKIKEDLWPMLKRFTRTLIHAKSASNMTSNIERRANNGGLAGATIDRDGCHQCLSQLAYDVAESVAFPMLEIWPSESILLLKALQRLDGDGLWFLLWQTGSTDKRCKRLDGVNSCSAAVPAHGSMEVVFDFLVENLPHPIPPPFIVNRFKKHRRLLEGIV